MTPFRRGGVHVLCLQSELSDTIEKIKTRLWNTATDSEVAFSEMCCTCSFNIPCLICKHIDCYLHLSEAARLCCCVRRWLWLKKVSGPPALSCNESELHSVCLSRCESTSCPVSHSSVFHIPAFHGVFLSFPKRRQCLCCCFLLWSYAFMVIFWVLSTFLPSVNCCRNPILNATCCGFLQKLSMCLLFQSDAHCGSSHGIHSLHAWLHHSAQSQLGTTENNVILLCVV